MMKSIRYIAKRKLVKLYIHIAYLLLALSQKQKVSELLVCTENMIATVS